MLDCGAQDIHERLREVSPDLNRLELEDEDHYRKYLKQRNAKALPPPFILPIVFHIVHGGGSENLSEGRVLAGLKHANEAFANQGYYDPATGVDTRIQFCLAQRTPDNGPTGGITRRTSALTNLEYNLEDRDLKALVQWDPLSYINVYVVRDICRSPGNGCEVAGYAYYPNAHGLAIDGIVMEARWLGSSEANAGVLVHELGHYLGLRHTFHDGCNNDDCLSDGDAVCDTPPDNSTAAVPCTGSVNTCSTDTDSGFATDQDDMTENYMDYGYFKCYSAFTQGQTDRMHSFIDGRRRSLQESFGCLPPCPAPVVADFAGGGVTVNVGTTVDFIDRSSNGVTYSWRVDGLEEATTEDFSRAFPTEGTFSVQLLVESSDPLCMSDSIRATVRVVCPVTADYDVPTPITEGVPVTFTNNSTNATGFSWAVDGVTVTSGRADLVFTFPDDGLYRICLTADDGNCSRERCRSVFARSDTPGGGGGGPGGDCNEPFTALYGLDDPDRPREFTCLQENGDGTFYVGGSSRDHPLLVRTDPAGQPIWSVELFPDARLGYVTGLTFDREGMLVAFGATQNEGTGGPNRNGWAARIDPADGRVLWSQEYTSQTDERVFKELLHPRPGGPYLVVGESFNVATGATSGLITRIDAASGAIQSESHQDNGARITFGGAAAADLSGAVIAAGVGEFGLSSASGLRLASISAAGVLTSDRIVHDDARVALGEQRVVADGGDVVIVTDYRVRGGRGGLRVYRLRPDGGVVFAVQITGPNQSMDLRTLRLTPSGYLIHVNAGGVVDQLILLDKAGAVIWSSRYETGVGAPYAVGQALVVSGGIPALATSDPTADNVTYLSRFDPSGVPVAGCLAFEAVELNVTTLDVVGADLTYTDRPGEWGESFLGWEPTEIVLADQKRLKG